MTDWMNLFIQAKVPNSSQLVDIYQLQNVSELGCLCDSQKNIRLLYNGENIYAWKADMLDHKEVRKYIDNADDYIGLRIEQNELIPSMDAIKHPLLDKFKTEWQKI